MAEILRTPDEAFANIPDYPFEPYYFNWGDIRMHYLDEGSGPPVVLFHGEPTWSFLYRKVIPELVGAGYRCIAPDYVGFGKSDKPADDAFYTYDMHSESVAALLESLDLSRAAIVVQDWGGPIGLRFAVENSSAVTRLVILNTGIAFHGARMSDAWHSFLAFVKSNDDLPIGFLMERSQAHDWGQQVLDAYDAPFPGVEYKAGARRFPQMVPLGSDDDGATAMAAVDEELAQWEGPAYVLFSTGDPIFSTETGQRLVDHIPGADRLDTIEGAGHFLQEDRGEEVGRRIAAWLQGTG